MQQTSAAVAKPPAAFCRPPDDGNVDQDVPSSPAEPTNWQNRWGPTEAPQKHNKTGIPEFSSSTSTTSTTFKTHGERLRHVNRTTIPASTTGGTLAEHAELSPGGSPLRHSPSLFCRPLSSQSNWVSPVPRFAQPGSSRRGASG